MLNGCLAGGRDDDLHEGERGAGDFLRRVLATVGQPRKASDLHHDDGVALTEADARGALRDLDRKSETLASSVDGCRVVRVQAHRARRDDGADLICREIALAHGDLPRGEHAGAESKAEELHFFSKQKPGCESQCLSPDHPLWVIRFPESTIFMRSGMDPSEWSMFPPVSLRFMGSDIT